MSYYWVKELESSDSRIHKEAVIKQVYALTQIGDMASIRFLKLLKICYDPFTTFGVSAVPEIDTKYNNLNPWDEFESLLTNLSNRSLTGNAARAAIDDVSSKFDSDEWNNFCRRIIIKDMRCGISHKTINKVLKSTAFEIPVFECQLASPIDIESHQLQGGTYYCEPKLDGVRALIMVIPVDKSSEYDGKVEFDVQCFSRNGKLFENFTQITEQIKNSTRKLVNGELTDRYFKDGFVLDGEITGKSFNQLMTKARRKESLNKDEQSDMVYHVFDVLPLIYFKKGYCNYQQYKRRDYLEKWYHVFSKMPNVRLVENRVVDFSKGFSDSMNFVMKYYNELVESGYEGLMLKNLNAPYEKGRGTFWLKMKPIITVDLEIIGFEEGTGRNSGRLGAIICAGYDNGRSITVNVGSGFSDTERQDFWNERNSIIGTVVEVIADSVSMNSDGTHSLRFPRFMRRRPDKSVEEVENS
jgi:DNA ligase 1